MGDMSKVFNIELTEKDYKIIRDALTDHYYISKDSGDYRRAEDITDLEVKLTSFVIV